MNSEIVKLERACLAAWPGRARAEMQGWVLQATDGFSQRANCVWPLHWKADIALDRAISEAAAWCEAHAIKACFKLADGATAPPDLTDALARAGFAPRMETHVMTRPIAPPAPSVRAPPEGELSRASATEGEAPPRGVDIALFGAPNEDFFRPFAEAAPSAEDFAERRDIVLRIAGQRVFAIASTDQKPAAIGLGITSDDLVGLYLMRTAPWARRRGLARALVDALINWGAERGAATAYLQVEESNPGAMALYANAGFTTAYRYRYWTKAPSAP